MTFDLPPILLISAIYLSLLFIAAYFCDTDRFPRRITQHPLINTLSFGAYASAWTLFNALGIASADGYAYLASFIGAGAAFILAPLLLVPVLKITRTYQLSSLADLFAFRFRSATVGIITTLLMLVASLPLITLQIKAIVQSLQLIQSSLPQQHIAAAFCTLIAMFAILFGARHPSLRKSHRGFVFAVAIQSLIKLSIVLLLSGVALFAIFGGADGLLQWFDNNPEVIQTLRSPPSSGNWDMLILAFFTAAVISPHMFHLIFTENRSTESLYKASWIMPLFLLIISIAILPIVWANAAAGFVVPAEFSTLAIGHITHQPILTLIAFLGALSASSTVIIISSVALAAMIQNHLLLPLTKVPDTARFYTWLLWQRRILILLLIFLSYLFFEWIGRDFKMIDLGLIAFNAFLQFLPGLMGTLYWSSASRSGFLLGLGTGALIWVIALLIPPMGIEHWHLVTLIALIMNIVMMISGSQLMPAQPDERQIAEACLINGMPRPLGGSSAPVQENFLALLKPRLGADTARREINRARKTLNLPLGPLSPLNQLRMRNQLEHNLSGLLGPVEAAALFSPRAPTTESSSGVRAREVHLLEQQLEHYDAQLSGLAAEVDQLRRYHRQTLQRLPLGACTLDGEQRIQLWNATLERYTGIDVDNCIGSGLDSLPAPWDSLLSDFATCNDMHQNAQRIDVNGQPRWFSLHKAALGDASGQGMVLLVDDETEHQVMTEKLSHQERLASIGRFAAGVAHEIGNPVTGIACLAQNQKYETDNTEVITSSEQILEQTKRISRIVQSLVRFAHTGQSSTQQELEPLNLHECASDAIRFVRLDSRVRQQTFDNQIPTHATCLGDGQQLLQVFINLLNNASDASEDYGVITLEGSADDYQLTIRITDDGSGISKEHQQHLFEPFYTTKEPGKGTGLGLSLVYNILREHYGKIELISPINQEANRGTQVVITLPRYSPPDTTL